MKQKLIMKCVLYGIVLAISSASALAEDKTQALVQQCTMCHGADGNSPTFAAPTIAGLNKYYFKYSIDAYKNDGRASDMMKMFATNLSDADIEILAAYYAKQIPKPSEQTFDANMAAKGKDLHNRYCEKCHTENGGASVDGYGILAGQWMPFLKLVLDEYESGKRRTNPMMMLKLKRMRKEAGEKSIENLLHYYASLK